MPTGQPDSILPYDPPDPSGSQVERIIGDAMAAGEFDDLPGMGEPIPGAGTRDNDMWWVRRWIERNRATRQSDSSSPA